MRSLISFVVVALAASAVHVALGLGDAPEDIHFDFDQRVRSHHLLSSSQLSATPIWTSCCDSSCLFTPIDVTLSPNPPKIGQDLTVDLNGTWAREILDGVAKMDVEFFSVIKWVKAKNFTKNICDYTATGHCPIVAGTRSSRLVFHINSSSPNGKYRGKVTMDTLSGTRIACFTFNTTMSK